LTENCAVARAMRPSREIDFVSVRIADAKTCESYQAGYRLLDSGLGRRSLRSGPAFAAKTTFI